MSVCLLGPQIDVERISIVPPRGAEWYCDRSKQMEDSMWIVDFEGFIMMRMIQSSLKC